MPLPSSAKLPRPKDDQEFEDIVADAVSVRWRCDARRNGRSGQAQQGVDIYGQPADRGGAWSAVQCKNSETISLRDITAEIAEAVNFLPTLSEFFIAVGGPRDSRFQEALRRHTAEQLLPFKVSVLFWDDIVNDISSRVDLVRKYWPAWLPGAGVEAGLQVAYVVLRSAEILQEILAGEFSRFHLGNVKLASTHATPWLDQVAQEGWDSSLLVWPETLEAALAVARRQESRESVKRFLLDGGFSWTPSGDEVLCTICEKSPGSRLLIDSGVPAEGFARAHMCLESGDGPEGPVSISYQVRAPWPVLLAITNMGQDRITIASLESTVDHRREYRLAADLTGSKHVAQLPAVVLERNTTVLFPLGTLVPPLDYVNERGVFLSSLNEDYQYGEAAPHWGGHDVYQELAIGALEGAYLNSVGVVGPFVHPIALQLSTPPRPLSIRRFDPARVYTISRYCFEGECPYLFARLHDRIEFIGELFSQVSPSTVVEESVVVPTGAIGLVVAELDHECSVLEEVTVNGHAYATSRVLRRGSWLDIPAAEGDRVTIRGKYLVGKHRW